MWFVFCRDGWLLVLGGDFGIVELAAGAAFIPLFLTPCHVVLGEAHCNPTGEFAAASSAVVDDDTVSASIHCRSLVRCAQIVLHAGDGLTALTGGVVRGECIGSGDVKLEESLDKIPCW